MSLLRESCFVSLLFMIISQMNIEVIEVDGTFVEVRSLWYYQWKYVFYIPYAAILWGEYEYEGVVIFNTS